MKSNQFTKERDEIINNLAVCGWRLAHCIEVQDHYIFYHKCGDSFVFDVTKGEKGNISVSKVYEGKTAIRWPDRKWFNEFIDSIVLEMMLEDENEK